MGFLTSLDAVDGHKIECYFASPASGSAKGGIVVIQEIFGLTDHVKQVVDGYAAAGYQAVAPAMFDRIEPGIVLDYAQVEKGIECVMQLERANCITDVHIGVTAVRAAGRIGVVGYCWGGAIAYLAACELTLAGVVSYYGGQIGNYLDKVPACPMMYHFGEKDAHIPPESIEAIKQVNPEGIYHLYADADHGFNCNDRDSYHQPSATLALERSLEFFDEHVGTPGPPVTKSNAVPTKSDNR
jgi:carboxymethylenebutenolidase